MANVPGSPVPRLGPKGYGLCARIPRAVGRDMACVPGSLVMACKDMACVPGSLGIASLSLQGSSAYFFVARLL